MGERRRIKLWLRYAARRYLLAARSRRSGSGVVLAIRKHFKYFANGFYGTVAFRRVDSKFIVAYFLVEHLAWPKRGWSLSGPATTQIIGNQPPKIIAVLVLLFPTLHFVNYTFFKEQRFKDKSKYLLILMTSVVRCGWRWWCNIVSTRVCNLGVQSLCAQCAGAFGRYEAQAGILLSTCILKLAKCRWYTRLIHIRSTDRSSVHSLILITHDINYTSSPLTHPHLTRAMLHWMYPPSKIFRLRRTAGIAGRSELWTSSWGF